MVLREHVLRAPPTLDDTEWRFVHVPAQLVGRQTNRLVGKCISFTHTAITLRTGPFPVNRVIHCDDPLEFVLVGFGEFRSEVFKARAAAEYMVRFFKAGLFLNGVQYRFYGHSNSQLRGRSCFLRRADTDAELDTRIYAMGELTRIMNVAKRAKRIGLLFSAAPIDCQLPPNRTEDIRDLKIGDELFSDGCGLMASKLAVDVSKQKRIIFRNVRYTPCIFQIRYRGYKGILMQEPRLRKTPQVLAQFRDSMRKFTATSDHIFSVVDYSKPYAFGRLNNDIIVLISALGISNDALLQKQREYFAWIRDAPTDAMRAVDFLSCLDRHDKAERVLLDGLDAPRVQATLRDAQMSEVKSFGKNEKIRVRMMIHKSRLLFGTCDPYGVLEEGQVHVRITNGKGATSLHETDVLVVRNPCLHPGDCLKLRAVRHPDLNHLVDCVVFPSKGRRAAPSMTSGGDLDGDKFLICWDPDLVPTRLMQSYSYPSNKEHVSPKVTRMDLAQHFASYNSSGLARVALLHQKWARNMPQGALCSQCQELNALHSSAVDGARVQIPERLLTPPESEEPYIIDLLVRDAKDFHDTFLAERAAESVRDVTSADPEDSRDVVARLLSGPRRAMSEFETFMLAARVAQKAHVDLRPFLPSIDFSALSSEHKHIISFMLGTTPQEDQYIWNSLFRSNILTSRDLSQRQLNRPLRMQRLYTSREQGLAAFFEYLQMGLSEYTRKLIILKTSDRFSVGIFMRGEVPWEEEPEVDDNVVVASFMPYASEMMSTYQTCTNGYRLYCGDGVLQLYEKQRGNTFIFLTRPAPASGGFVAASIALQKISSRVQKQVGRLNRSPVVEIEIHVVSNRDRVAHQLFDLRFDHVETEEFLKHQTAEKRTYALNTVGDFDWSEQPDWMQPLFAVSGDIAPRSLDERSEQELSDIIAFARTYHLDKHLFWAFTQLLTLTPLPDDAIQDAVRLHPPLVFCILKAFPPNDEGVLPDFVSTHAVFILRNLLRSANALGVAVLVALEKLRGTICHLSTADYLQLLEQASLCIRSIEMLRESVLVLNDIRLEHTAQSSALSYMQKHGMAIAIDRAEEAGDECPCDENGRPRKQRISPMRVRLLPIDSHPIHLLAHVRVDLPNNVRLHSNVRLQSASRPEKGWSSPWMMDGVVTEANKGELKIEMLHPWPAEVADMEWKLYNAGSTATAKAMMDAVLKLTTGGMERCRFYRHVIDPPSARSNVAIAAHSSANGSPTTEDLGSAPLNDSQRAAVLASSAPLSLIWGPPGTGKTTVVVQILRRMLRETRSETSKVLVTASTHNAVDNILERFVVLNDAEKLIRDEAILRFATDRGKVHKSLQGYTVDARVGAVDLQQDVRLLSKAAKRVKEAEIVFTTCAGAGLGALRSLDFDIVIIDEGSQITEPCALIPLVKGCQRAVIVGDHVQLRPTVRPMGKALEYDRSLLERLYTDMTLDVSRTMLDVQYRFPEELALFPSNAFYEGRLRTDMRDSAAALAVLKLSAFPWPVVDGVVKPVVFMDCAAEEDMGGSSKSNEGQAVLVARTVELLCQAKSDAERDAFEARTLSITALTPYSKQVKALHAAIPARFGAAASTIDSFQGRESDLIIFSTVRANAEHDIGFVDDARRLNVAWTRAKLGLILIGSRDTMTANPLWKRAIASCTEVRLPEVAET